MTNKIFPNKIILLGEIFNIKEISEYDLARQENDEDCIGKIDLDKKIIYISIDNEKTTPEEILMHELGHYFGNYYGISESEIFADSFANFILILHKQLGYKK